jgi:TonB family protein
MAIAVQAQFAPRILRRVEPVYPPLARTMRIQGTVRLQAAIDLDGSVAALKLISGHPLLVDAAMDAAKQYRYEPVSRWTIMPISITFSINGDQLARPTNPLANSRASTFPRFAMSAGVNNRVCGMVQRYSGITHTSSSAVIQPIESKRFKFTGRE